MYDPAWEQPIQLGSTLPVHRPRYSSRESAVGARPKTVERHPRVLALDLRHRPFRYAQVAGAPRWTAEYRSPDAQWAHSASTRAACRWPTHWHSVQSRNILAALARALLHALSPRRAHRRRLATFGYRS